MIGVGRLWAFCTLPAFRHLEQTRALRGLPLMTTRILCTLGVQRRLVFLCEWLTLKPNCGFFPHMSQTFDNSIPFRWLNGQR